MKKNSVVKVCVVYYGSVSIVFKFCWEWQPRQIHNGHVQRLDQHCAASEKKPISFESGMELNYGTAQRPPDWSSHSDTGCHLHSDVSVVPLVLLRPQANDYDLSVKHRGDMDGEDGKKVQADQPQDKEDLSQESKLPWIYVDTIHAKDYPRHIQEVPV